MYSGYSIDYMSFTINVSVHGAKNIQKIAQLIAQLVENSTGQRVIVQLHDRSALLQRKNQQIQETKQKLLK